MRERPSGITVDVTRSTDAIDFDAWAEQYVRACLALLREKRQEKAA